MQRFYLNFSWMGWAIGKNYLMKQNNVAPDIFGFELCLQKYALDCQPWHDYASGSMKTFIYLFI